MILINSEETAQQLAADLSNGQKFITVDTEFIREVDKIPLLCLVQIATKSKSYVVDPMNVDLNFLKPFFADPNLKKVFHDAKQDIEILQNYGFEINNFHDTQLYEMILSTKENISYQSIVLNYTGKKLKKNYGMSDWTQRPLSKKQLKYATEDVTYLRKVYKGQIFKLNQLDRANWLDEEISQLPNKNSLEDSLNEASYPLLFKLLSWREEKSKEKKVSPEMIASDRLIKSICKKGIEYVRNLKNSRNLVDDREFLNYAEEIVEDFSPEKTQTEKNPVVDLLKTLLDIKSQEHNVAPIMIASVKDLIKFVSGDQNVKFLRGWRWEIFGNTVRDLMDGKIKLGIKENKVILHE
jgi:ribonuclease D